MRKAIVLIVIAIFSSQFVSAQKPEGKKDTKKQELTTEQATSRSAGSNDSKTKSVKKSKATTTDTASNDNQKAKPKKKINKKHYRHYINSQFRY